MSGHSKWSTIKRKKEATDSARGKLFSRLSRAITIAVKTGGGANPDTNHRLRLAIDAARAVNMPKVNIDRILSKAESEKDLHEITYEGFGPGNVGIIVEIATDNKNRSAQEYKSAFERGGGSFAGPGAVSFNFEPKGYFSIKKPENWDETMLSLIDLGVEDIDDSDSEVDIYVDQKDFMRIKEELEKLGLTILSSELTMKPVTYTKVTDVSTAKKILNLLDALEDQDDTQKVYSNLDVSKEILDQIED